jgi:hypothetical protein
VFALTNQVLARSDGFRFAVSQIGGWPPDRFERWAEEVEEAARAWSLAVEDGGGDVPALVSEEWSIIRHGGDAPLEELAEGHQQRLREALLTLHAIADEACAGLGVALDSSQGAGAGYRARGRELLGRTGSLARIDPALLRVLPKVRTPPTGRQSFSRYACVVGPGIGAAWNKIPARHRGTDARSEYARLLLLPWPLRVREADFRPVAGSLHRQAQDPFGFFEYAPAEGLDLDLVDRLLVAARDESGGVDVVVLPESALDESEIDDLETLLTIHGVTALQAGVRGTSQPSDRFAGNWLHIGLNPRLEKGEEPSEDREPWLHLRQNKHHRWSLDERQIYQYHLGGVLHPRIRWWEAMEVPRREVQFVELAELTIACLVCEDLAHSGEIADLIRSVGPTVVISVLLDGPQLPSRWSARYASVLADDPGSAVLTLTSYGMVARSRPHGRDLSPVIALWKDPAKGIREIPLEPGAQGVALTVCRDRTARRTADGRWPVDNGTHWFDVAVHQLRAAGGGSVGATPRSSRGPEPVLNTDQLTILTAWAEAVAEVLAHAPERVGRVIAEGREGAGWRSLLGLPEPSSRLAQAINSLSDLVEAVGPRGRVRGVDEMIAFVAEDRVGEGALDRIVRRVLLATLEERRTREPA